MSVAWLVGVDGEPLAYETVDGLRPGPNNVSIANVYAPPVVEITGVATLNGQPIDDDITIDVSITGGTDPGFTEVVATDPATGRFTLTRTLQRNATAVDVTATTTEPDNPAVTLPDISLRAGPNTVTVDLAATRTNLQVAGVMSVSGAIPAGDVTLQVISKAAGRPNQTATLQVDPDDTTGAYDLELLLPYWATSVEVVAQTSAQPADWPRITFTDLLAGDDPRTFDAVTEVQVLNLTGNLSMRTTPYDEPWRLSIAILDEAGAFVRFLDESIRIEPDALGNWSIDGLETPIVASQVRLDANTSFTFNTREVREVFDVGAGANDLEFNGTIDKVGLRISGTLLDDGDPATTSRSLNYRLYTDDHHLHYGQHVDRCPRRERVLLHRVVPVPGQSRPHRDRNEQRRLPERRDLAELRPRRRTQPGDVQRGLPPAGGHRVRQPQARRRADSGCDAAVRHLASVLPGHQRIVLAAEELHRVPRREW